MAPRFLPEGEDFVFPRDNYAPSAEHPESDLIRIGKVNRQRVGMSGLGNATQRRAPLNQSMPGAMTAIAAKPRPQVERIRVPKFAKGGKTR